MIEDIKNLFSKVNNKTKFIIKLSTRVPTKPQTIKQSWLCDSGFWSIPEKYQQIVKDTLNETINSQ